MIVDLLSKASNNITATLRFQNQSVDFLTAGTDAVTVALPGTYTVTYQTLLKNQGLTVAQNVALTYTLDSALTLKSVVVETALGALARKAGSSPAAIVPVPSVPSTLNPGDAVTVTVVATGTVHSPSAENWLLTIMNATDGLAPRQQIVWTYVPAFYTAYLPIVVR